MGIMTDIASGRVKPTKEQIRLIKEFRDKNSPIPSNFKIPIDNILDKELTISSDFLKLVKKYENKEIEPFERFKAIMLIEWAGFKSGAESWFRQDLNAYIKNNDKENISGVLSSLPNIFGAINEVGVIFKINETIKKLLFNTDTSYHSDIKCPYPFIFLSFKEMYFGFKDEMILGHGGININSIIIFPAKDYNTGEEKLQYFIFGDDLSDSSNFWHKNYINKDYTVDENVTNNAMFDRDHMKLLDKIIPSFILGFLNLINHPEVELIKHSKKELRENRIAKGRIGIPDEVEINLTGKLKKYIDEVTTQNEKAWELGYRFWVRGHWMEFKDECYKKAKGTKKWILPYIKGKGELINKSYYVGEKEQQWENEKRLISLVRELYLGYKIVKHNRTILNGLEIDCYIPELKLGFEYNGKQHYEWINVFHKTKEEFEAQKKRDVEKNKLAQEKSINLITIKFDELLTKELIIKKVKEEMKDGKTSI